MNDTSFTRIDPMMALAKMIDIQVIAYSKLCRMFGLHIEFQ